MKKPFCPMVPAEAMLRDKNITPRLLRVLLALYTFADQNGNCYPKRAALSDMCGMREAEISRATTDLQRLGWLTKTGNGGRNTPARYRLHPPQTVQDSCTVSEPQTVQDSCTVLGQTVQKSCTVSEPETVQDSCIKTVQESCTRIKHTNEHTSTRSRQAGAGSARASAPAQPNGFALEAKPAKRKRNTIPEVDMPEGLGIDAEEWAELLMVCRKKDKPLTPIRWRRMMRNAAEAGMKPHEVVSLCAGKGWASYEVEYNVTPQQSGARYESAMERNAREAQKWLNPKPAAQPNGVIIDVTQANREQFTLLEKTQ